MNKSIDKTDHAPEQQGLHFKKKKEKRFDQLSDTCRSEWGVCLCKRGKHLAPLPSQYRYMVDAGAR